MPSRNGFTIYEFIIGLFILIALGLLAAPAFNGLINKSKEGNARGGLAMLRGALEVYKADTGSYPTDDLQCLKKKYLTKIPKNELPGTPHEPRRHVTKASDIPELNDVGGWYYDNRQNSETFGKVRINCVHSNSLAERWDSL